MTLTKEKSGNELTVRLSGELNTLSAPELSALVDSELDGVQTLTLDFAQCDYVSSAGLRILLAAFKKMKGAKGTMKLINVGQSFSEVLQNTGLDSVFDIQ